MLAAGDRFDRYEIESLLGEGGMGRVYLAHDTRLGRRVALKILQVAGSADGAARLLREARIAAAFEHANAVGVYDVGEVDGTPYLAMEYVKGRSLRSALGDTTIPLVTRVRWLADVARALGAAHARGLVHRDVKPENIMIRADGVAKVLDFGIARQEQLAALGDAVTADPALVTLTAEGTVIGTPAYMAPEQMLAEPVDGRADQFAWGIMACEVLTGKLPWRAARAQSVQLVAEIVGSAPAPKVATLGVVPAEIADVIDRALAKDRAARFPSMNEIVDLLDAAVAQLDAAGSGPTARQPVAASAPARSFGKWSYAAVVVALGSIGLFLFTRSRTAMPATTATASAPSSSIAPIPTKMMELPIPPGANADAVVAFRKARQDLHDASRWRAATQLEAATRLDSSFDAPKLLALAWWSQNEDKDYSATRQLRSSLSERDQLLLDALAPNYTSVPADLAATASNVAAAAALYPGDAELQALAGYWFGKASRFDEASAAIDRALTLDPSFALAHWVRAQWQHDPAAQLRELEACIAASSTAGSCARNLAFIRQRAGDCDRMEADVKRLVVMEPTFEGSQGYLLNAIVARGGTREETEPVLRTLRDLPPEGKAVQVEPWPAIVAFQFGSFAEGLKSTAELPDGRHRRAPLTMLAASETGDTSRALAEARTYLASRATGGEGTYEDDVVALRVAGRAGGDPPPAAARVVAQWDSRGDQPLAAILVHAGIAITPLAAHQWAERLDLDALNRARPPFGFTVAGNAMLGSALALGGRPDDAIPFLEAASRVCGVWEASVGRDIIVFARIEARLALADVLAAKGDTVSACGWFGKVAAQWADAKPRSMSAERAQRRMRELRCKK